MPMPEFKSVPPPVERSSLPLSHPDYFRVDMDSSVAPVGGLMDASLTSIPAHRIQFNLDTQHIVSAHLVKPGAVKPGANHSVAALVSLNESGTAISSGLEAVEAEITLDDDAFYEKLQSTYAPSGAGPEMSIVIEEMAGGLRRMFQTNQDQLNKDYIQFLIEKRIDEAKRSHVKPQETDGNSGLSIAQRVSNEVKRVLGDL